MERLILGTIDEVDKVVDAGYRTVFGQTSKEAQAEGVCVNCKKPPTFYSDAGRREYDISGVCEPCFDEMFAEEE